MANAQRLAVLNNLGSHENNYFDLIIKTTSEKSHKEVKRLFNEMDEESKNDFLDTYLGWVTGYERQFITTCKRICTMELLRFYL